MQKVISLRQMVLIALLGGFFLESAPGTAYAGDQESFNLGYRFKPGASAKYKAEFTQEYEFRGLSFFRLFDLEFEEKCTEAVNDTLFKMELTFSKANATLKRNDELQDFTIGQQMEGQTFMYNLNSKGIISNVEAKGFLDDEKAVLGILNIILSSSYPYLPDSTVGIGAEWTFSGSNLVETKTDMDIESSTTFKAKEFKKEKGRRCVKINMKGETYFHGRMDTEVGKFVIDGSGEGKGEYLFDVENGQMVKFKRQTGAKITSIDASGSSGAKRDAFDVNLIFQLRKELK